MRHFLIDTDAASDDAVALIMALRDKSCHVDAITVVGGVLSGPQAGKNCRASIEVAESYVPPVYVGTEKPFWNPPRTAESAHGKDGLSDRGLSENSLPETPGHAVDAILDYVRSQPAPELITLGPLTNIALAILMDAQAMAKVKQITVMGGQWRMPNNCTANAEYNIWVDAEAADIVFQSGIPLLLVPLEACYGKAEISAADREKLLSMGTRRGRFIVEANTNLLEFNRRFYGKDIISLPDPSAVACCLRQGVITGTFTAAARVEAKSKLGYGQVLYDTDPALPHNVTLVTSIDADAFKAYLFETAGEAPIQ